MIGHNKCSLYKLQYLILYEKTLKVMSEMLGKV